MPKITVTDELINILKSERKSRNFKSSDLSSKLKKNTSFISMLENGRIEELDLDVFYRIFETLIPDEKNRSEFVNDLLQNLSVKLTDGEIKRQLWMATFDLQYRLIVIPEGIYNFMVEKINEFKLKDITIQNIVDEINLNEGIDETKTLEENKVYVEYTEDEELSFSIKFKLEQALIDNIIKKKIKKINYVNLLGIVSAMYKLDGYNKDESIQLTRELLYKNKFYTLIEKQSIIRHKDNDLLNEHDKEFMKLKNILVHHINYLGDKDVEYINEKLTVLCKNLNEEPSLTLAVIGISLVELNELDTNKKKEFINEFKEMIQRYKNVSNTSVIERLD